MSSEPLQSIFARDLDNMVDKYRDQGLSYAEVIGTLEVYKIDLYHELSQDEDE
jgi:hypothetical protein